MASKKNLCSLTRLTKKGWTVGCAVYPMGVPSTSTHGRLLIVMLCWLAKARRESGGGVGCGQVIEHFDRFSGMPFS